MLQARLKSLLNLHPSSKIIALVADDFLKSWRLGNKQLHTSSGSSHLTRSTEASVAYIEEVFNDYKKYGGLEHFYGVTAELGPGDNAGVAMLMRGDGCEEVDLIDRFYSRRNFEQQNKIYAHLAKKHGLSYLQDNLQWDEKLLLGIEWKIGKPAEIYFQECKNHKSKFYDFLVSRAVLEHLYDPLEALIDMVTCLKPGGKMLHKIDFRDHGMFTPQHHELKFLEIPSYIYPLMVRNSGRPNRILIHHYREALEDLKNQGLINYSLLVTRLVDVGEITPHKLFEEIENAYCNQAIDWVEKRRHKFAQEFRTVESKDLAVSGVFLIVIKQ